MRANHIYTRVMDTNTPITKSADINHVEYLWRKRFHIDETPLEKFYYYLAAPDEWSSIRDSDMGFFYKEAPEYTIVCEDDEDSNGYEYFLSGQIDQTPSWWYVTLWYHQTAIEQFRGIALDGGRCFVIAPRRAYELCETGISAVGYFIRGDLSSRLLEFFRQKEYSEDYSFRTFMEALLVFSAENERELFWAYVKQNPAIYQELYKQQGDKRYPYFHEIEWLNMGVYKNEYREALTLKQMLVDFRDKYSATAF